MELAGSVYLHCLAAEEQFEAGGEELRRHFSMDGGFEPEKLRAAPSAEAQRQGPDPLFTGDSGQGDDIMSTGKLFFFFVAAVGSCDLVVFATKGSSLLTTMFLSMLYLHFAATPPVCVL